MTVSYFGKVSEFVTYTLLIYGCYITSGVYHEKILKHKYKNIIDGQFEPLQAPIVFTLFPPLVASLIGLSILNFKNEAKQEGVQIPFKKSFICSAIITLNMWTYNKAIVFSSFSASVMVKSCSLLSVILVGVFCSRVKDKNLKLGTSKIWIGAIACLGIIVFNLFKKTDQSSDKPLTIIGIVFLGASLLGDGFLPDLQAEIKSLYKPTTIEMYYQINVSTLLIALVYGVLSFELVYIFVFLASHEEILGDIAIFSVLNSIGQLVIYQMIKMFRQHVPPFIIATRKCFTVIVNIIYFGHSVNFLQVLGILFVFFAVMMEVYQNYRQKQAKIKESNTISQIELQDDSLVRSANPQLQLPKKQQANI